MSNIDQVAARNIADTIGMWAGLVIFGIILVISCYMTIKEKEPGLLTVTWIGFAFLGFLLGVIGRTTGVKAVEISGLLTLFLTALAPIFYFYGGVFLLVDAIKSRRQSKKEK